MASRWMRGVRRILMTLDAAVNRVYTWRYNPLYQSGALAVVSLGVLLATGLYLLLFYRIGEPYASVQRISDQAWLGRWIRPLHRYASAAAVLAAFVHAIRMLLQGRCWGPRLLAWLSGVVLLALMYVCGWTGYVMVWDPHGQLLALEGARLLDALPLFSEPLVRIFVGEQPIPGAFYFLNLFAHIALPVGMAGLLWLHVSRVSRPVLVPPRPLWIVVTILLVAVALVWPAPLEGPADPFRLSPAVSLDLLYGFWLPGQVSLGPLAGWGLLTILLGSALLVPLFSRPTPERGPPASVVDERLCTGCEQCYIDCPYEAISMVPRSDERPTLLARVDAARCVSCGICAGSCAPMGVGPPGRDGRTQLAEVRQLITDRGDVRDQVVVLACRHSGGAELGVGAQLPLSCVGNLHTSILEYVIRAGAAGALVVACPPRDCWSREGPRWLNERVYHDREAELKPRVDRRRVRIVHAAGVERASVHRALERFRADLARLARPVAETIVEIDPECAPPIPREEAWGPGEKVS